jgi:hypothetical protein
MLATMVQGIKVEVTVAAAFLVVDQYMKKSAKPGSNSLPYGDEGVL